MKVTLLLFILLHDILDSCRFKQTNLLIVTKQNASSDEIYEAREHEVKNSSFHTLNYLIVTFKCVSIPIKVNETPDW